MNYEALLEEADSHQLTVKEKNLIQHDGLISGNKIAIRKDIETHKEKSCVLAEELGHYYTSSGNIIDMQDGQNRKQEHRARLWAYKRMVTMDKLTDACKCGCRNRYEIAEYLDVTEEFLQEAIDSYKQIYGTKYYQYGDCLICFDPLNIYPISE